MTEGLKVVEDVVRLGLEKRKLLTAVRSLRNRVGKGTLSLRRRVIACRGSETDPGRGDRFDRTRRRSLEDVLFANLKRAQESCRVLEEVLKLAEPGLSGRFKAARFRLYDIEREVAVEVRSQKAGAKGQESRPGRAE